MIFDSQEFYNFCKIYYLKENKTLYKRETDILFLINVINSVYKKAHDILDIPLNEKYYTAWFLLDFLMDKTNKFNDLKTPELISYLNQLPSYQAYNILSESCYEHHGHLTMQILRMYPDFCLEKKLNFNDFSTSKSIEKIEEFLKVKNEKDKLENILSPNLSLIKSQKI